ncbi:MAG: protein-glutamate O-methyltransferase CheR [Gammaproteobacteria bacterium]|nr:protein-glutamate O-methyltransferase CheR [Gammaproteobacteria bacterium]
MTTTEKGARPLAPRQDNAREFTFTLSDFKQVKNRLYDHAGIALADHKLDLVYNRLVRRIRALKVKSFREYFIALDNSPEEFNHFINAMTTNLTSFYREAHHFEYISNTYLPALAKQGQKTLRVWSSACSVGEEPYSIAISLLDSSVKISDWKIEIFATDIDTNVLATAKTAVYPMKRIEGLSLKRKKIGFLRGKGTHKSYAMVKPSLQSWVKFDQCNLMEAWPVTGPLDIIFCRNVMIYFDKETQWKLLERMATLLKPGGLLCIGHSESLPKGMTTLKLLGRTIYQKIK